MKFVWTPLMSNSPSELLSDFRIIEMSNFVVNPGNAQVDPIKGTVYFLICPLHFYVVHRCVGPFHISCCFLGALRVAVVASFELNGSD
jgi:hypothetical protein